VSYRRIATIIAVLAASVALVPTLAFAGDAPHPAARDADLSGSPLTAAKSAGFKTFTSSSSRSVYTGKSASKSAAAAVTGNVALDATAESAYSFVLSGGQPTPAAPESTFTINWGDGTTGSGSLAQGPFPLRVSHTYTELGTYTITVTVTDDGANTETGMVTVTTAGSDYTAYGPTRVLDTRYGTGAPKAPVKSRSIAQVKFAGNGGIPADVTAVVLNVTVTDPTAAGFVTVYGDGSPRPATSNVNFVKGQTVPNQVIAPVGADGKVDFYNGSTGSTDLIADVAGYFTQTPSSGYSTLSSPYRLVDTRNGTGEPKRPLAGKSSFAVQIAGNDGGYLPASGITAVALNITSTASLGSGYLTVYADGSARPTASNVNFSANQTIANSVITPVGSDGKILVYNGSTAATSVVVDIVGYYSAASEGAYVPITPTRLLDTRQPSPGAVSGPLPEGDYTYLAPFVPVVVPGVTSFVLNATVTETTGSGDLRVSPDPNTLADYDSKTAVWPTKPSSSTLNWTKGETVANLVQASAGGNGIVDFWNSGSGDIALIVDAFGYYATD
jgi:hypothetical protein